MAYRWTKAWVGLVGLAVAGCYGGNGDGSGDGSSGGDDGGPVTTSGVVDTSGGPDATTSSSSGGDASSSGADSTGTAGALDVDVTVHLYPEQPMVVDLAFSEPDLTVAATHTTDPGVHTGPVAGDPGETWLRVRGLAPATAHAMDWTVEDADGRTAEGTVDIVTEVALPGYRESFLVEGAGPGPNGYLLFDLLSLDPTAPASLFVVDSDGVTRWHVGELNRTVDPSIVYAGAKLRADGTLLYLRDYTIFVIDELTHPVVALDSATLGVPGLHHDVIELDNGNFLTMSFTFRDIDDPGPGTIYVAGDMLLEVTPDGSIVWQWDAFDHLDVNRRPPGFDEFILDPQTLQAAHDWTHSNGLLYDSATDSVYLSMRHQDWVIRIDRATGDVVWRFGDGGDFSLAAGTWPYHQHSPQWQADGSLVLYDNGLFNPGVPDPAETSRAVRYDVDEGTMTVTQVWEDAAEDFMSPIAGDVDRLDDGALLITDSSIDLGMGPAAIHARVRKVVERMPSTPQWEFTTELGTFIYRCVNPGQLPGETP